MHIVAGGDYGYRYRNGRKGFHPSRAGTVKSRALCR
ncbi:MAG: hypothetical protein CM1200mP2_12980 [Planctomycetaceae bacterium]|nr:MAG: hypothetical protein CM1200mP2_12980 [Planctomycetaceae bacterium]